MNLKKFTATISLTIAALSFPEATEGCIEVHDGGYSSAPFMVVAPLGDSAWGNTTGYDETLDFWSSYVKGNVSRDDIRDFFDNVTIDSIPDCKYRLYTYLKKRGDSNALNYITDCLEFISLLDEYNYNTWRYDKPSTDKMTAFCKKIGNVKTSATFKPRYDFLKIRIYGALGDNDGVMKVWDEVSAGMKPSALRDRLEGYVGGVLYRRGEYAQALDYFYRSHDYTSIMWCIDKLAGSDNIVTLYEYAPNSMALRYIIQDFMNYLIATSKAGRTPAGIKSDDDTYDNIYSDATREATGRPIYDVVGQRDEMIKLFERVLNEGKTETPMMWATALGVLRVMKGERTEGLAILKDAAKMKGDACMKENLANFTLWALLLNSGKGDAATDGEFVTLLKQRYNKAYKASYDFIHDYSKEGIDRRKRYQNMDHNNDERDQNKMVSFMTDFFVLEATTHFYESNQPQRAMAIYALMDHIPYSDMWYCTSFTGMLRDDINKNRPLEDGRAFLAYIKTDRHGNPIDEYLQPYTKEYANLTNDVIGTRLMRDLKFEEALPYLAEVDPRWSCNQAIAPYLNTAYYSPEYYDFGHKYYNTNQYPLAQTNYKAEFCAGMLEALSEYDRLEGDAKALKAIEIAIRYHFACPLGDGWGISDYRWSLYEPVNEFTTECQHWLEKGLSLAVNPNTRVIAGYGLLCMPSFKNEYDTYDMAFGNNYRYGNELKYFLNNPTKMQLQALNYIKSQWNPDDMPYHVGHCDILESYVAGTFIDKPKKF